MTRDEFDSSWEKTFGKKEEPRDREVLALLWDMWIMHGLEPSDDAKDEVRGLGLSAEVDDIGKTLRALMGRIMITIPVWVPKLKCARCGTEYGGYPDQCESAMAGVDPGPSGWDNFCGSTTFLPIEVK